MIDAGDDLNRAEEAKQRALRELAHIPQINGIGITRIGKRYGIKINLTTALTTEQLPAEFDGVPVISEVVGVNRALAD